LYTYGTHIAEFLLLDDGPSVAVGLCTAVPDQSWGLHFRKTLHLTKLWLVGQGLSGNCELWSLPTPAATEVTCFLNKHKKLSITFYWPTNALNYIKLKG
jgi:hypothetical protein